MLCESVATHGKLLGSNQIAKPANSSKGYQIRGKKRLLVRHGDASLDMAACDCGKGAAAGGQKQSAVDFQLPSLLRTCHS